MNTALVALMCVGVLLFLLGLVLALRGAPTDRYDEYTGEWERRSASGPLWGGIAAGLVGALVVAMTGIALVVGGGSGGDTSISAVSTGESHRPEAPMAEQGAAPSRETVTATATAEAPSSGSAAAPARGSSGSVPGDLGLSVPMTRPACDGRGIVVLQSAVTPDSYASEIGAALAANPGASYLRTDQSCPSLRQRDENGNVIYAVYRPSGYSRAELCADVSRAPAGAYGRWLDTTSDPTQLVTC